jgi:hypothetical protein
MSKIHIGKKIKEVWRKSRLKGTEFASMINRDRQVIYDIFKRESIDTELLQQISKVLNHDFFSYYSGDLPLVIEPKTTFGYASKEEVADLKRMMGNLIQEFEQIRERLPQKKSLDKTYSKNKKHAGGKKK